jgi:hypothetical protein
MYVFGTFFGQISLPHRNGIVAKTLTSAGATPHFLAKYSNVGELQWAVSFAGIRYGLAKCLPDGGSYVSLNTNAAPTFIANNGSSVSLGGFGGNQTSYTILIDANGNHVWTARATASSRSEITAMTVDAGGNVNIGGWYGWGWGGPSVGGTLLVYSSSGTLARTLNDTERITAFLVKYSRTGAVLWSNFMGDPPRGFMLPDEDYAFGIGSDPENNVRVLLRVCMN